MVRVPQLGRPISVTLGLAVTILVVIYGGMEIWPRIETYRQMQALDRIWRDGRQSPAARAKAIEMLAEYGPESAPYLLEATRDADGRVRERAYSFLAGLEPIPDEVFGLCVSAVTEDREPRARASAAATLGTVAYGCRQVRVDRRRRIIDCLVVAGRDESPMVRLAAIRALVGAHAVEVDPAPWLRDADWSVRLAAAEAVFWLDPGNRGRVVPMLQAMVLEAGPGRPRDVVLPMALLYRADPSACRGLVPTFVGWLRHEDADVRNRVVLWLAHLGPLARDAAPALEGFLDRGAPADRARAAFAIISIDPSGCDRAAACLLELLGDAAVGPRERGLALRTVDAMFKQTRVPSRLRDDALRAMQMIPDQPGIHPDLSSRIRLFLEMQRRPRPEPPGRGGAAARLISAPMD